jgi:hypothetical protein
MLRGIKIASITLLFLSGTVFATQAQVTDNPEAHSDTLQERIWEAGSYHNQQRLPSHIKHAQPITPRNIDEQKWADAAQDLDYSKDVERENPTQRKDMPPPANSLDSGSGINWTGLGQLIQVIIIALVLLGLGYAIHRMLQQPQNARIAYDGTEITSDNVDQYLHETDLDRFLKDALREQNYTLAIRLYYLQIIKELSNKNAIQWSKEKTNRDYQREMRNHHLADPFRRATRSFEQAWYGKEPLSAAQYTIIAPQFQDLLRQI